MKMQSVWQVSKTAIFKEEMIPGLLRINESPHFNLVVCEQSIAITEIKDVYVRIKRKGFICRSIKIFSEGKLPNLSSYDFVKEQQWYVYPHEEIDIAAVPYGKNEWCYLIEKRNGQGIPLQVFDVLPLFPSPAQISLWEEIV